MISSTLFSLFLAAAPPPLATDVVAVKAGTIHLLEEDRVLRGGGTILMRDGRIVAVGEDLDLPLDARIVDYGPDAVIVPGLVAADSPYGGTSPSERSADPTVRASDAFDPFSSYARTVAGGVTTAYLPPTRGSVGGGRFAVGRLIAGQGAVAKLGVEPGTARLLVDAGPIHGSIGVDARQTPGYWEPPVPATVDVGIGIEQRQLPRTTMGAVLALRELLDATEGTRNPSEYGPTAGPELARLIKANRTWRMGAEGTNEIRALLTFFGEHGLPLVVEGAAHAALVADELAAAGVPVILSVDLPTNRSPRDHGKDRDAEWPRHDTAAVLARAGVTFAIVPADRRIGDLRFVAMVASRGGLDDARALRAITLDAARVLGVDDRVGSIAAGKDGDLVVLNGSPMAPTSSVLATWIAGDVAWKAHESAATVLSVDELHVGDGEVLEPGQVLIEDGRIVEVGRLVAHPLGATVIRGRGAMPGMIDARGHLGLEGSTRTPQTRFEMKRIIAPGNATDRRVAQAGVTTVLLTPRGIGRTGAPIMAYKPAGTELERMVIADPAAVQLTWTDSNRLKSGDNVRDTLQKAVEYKQKWDEYEKALAEWTPPDEEPGEEEPADEESSGEDEGKDGEDKKNDKDDKKKKGKDDEEARPVTGVWQAEVRQEEDDEPSRLRLRLLEHEDGSLEGSLRCALVSERLVPLSGERKEEAVTLSGRAPEGRVRVEATAKGKKMTGKVSLGELELELEAEQTSEEYEVIRRPEPSEEDGERPAAREPKGKPRPPSVNADLEPLRSAMDGKVAVVVGVDRQDEILACLEAFEEAGIRPILFGANEAWKIVDQVRGRVAGVLLDHRVIYTDSEMGTRRRNRYAELASAGVPVAFHSSAEEGAAELPLVAAYAVSQGMSPEGALRALTAGAAHMMGIEQRVGRIAPGLDADLLLLDGSPLDFRSRVLRVWVDGREIR